MNRSLTNITLCCYFGFLYLPIAVLIAYSFNDLAFTSSWHHFTFKWYQTLIQDTDLIHIVFHSLTLAFSSASIATVLGSLAAVALHRYLFFGKKILASSILLLIILPDIVLGIALLLLFYLLHIKLGFWTLLVAHVTFCLPFVIFTLNARMNDFDNTLIEVAKDLGANDFMIFNRVLIPLLLPAIMAAWLLSFTLSLDDLIISFFVSGPSYQILPLYIYSMVRLGVTPEVNALGSILFLITILFVTLSQLLLRKK